MRRRVFLLSVCGIAGCTLPKPSPAQGRITRLGVLTPSPAQYDGTTLVRALAALGRSLNERFVIEMRSADGALDRLPALARELGELRPDLLIAVNSPATRAALDHGPGVPVVAAIVGDPVALGFVPNLSRPGGRVTGVANLSRELTTKRLALLRDVLPSLGRVAAFFHPDDPISVPQLRDLDAVAGSLGVVVARYPVRRGRDVEVAMARVRSEGCEAVLRLAGQGFTVGPITGRLATEHGLPAIVLDRPSVLAGGLMSYSADGAELWRRVASLVDRILQGVAPGEIPFEQPTKFEFIINLRTARTLNLTVPALLLAQADEVIE